ncbi:MAG: hypothetical protein ACP5OC_08490 [Thermoplasmata archaeon]
MVKLVENKSTRGYLLSLASSLTYSVWLVGSGFIILMSLGSFPIFYLLVIMCAGMLFSLIYGFPKSIDRYTLIPILSGILFALANFSMYFLIKSNDITVASSFAEFNVLFFPVLLFIFNKKGTKFSKYLVGLFLVTFGLIVENVVSSGSYALTPLNVLLGVLMGFLYAAATYVLYLSTKNSGPSNSRIFYVFLAESVVLFIFWSSLKFKIEPALNVTSIAISLIISASLVVALGLEISGYRSLSAIGFRQITIGNVLSNLELLPVIVFSFVLYPSLRVQYTLGLLLVTAGILIVSIDIENFQRLHK